MHGRFHHTALKTLTGDFPDVDVQPRLLILQCSDLATLLKSKLF